MRRDIKNVLLSSIVVFNLFVPISRCLAQTIPDSIPDATTVYDANILRQLVIIQNNDNTNFQYVRNSLNTIATNTGVTRGYILTMLNNIISMNTGIAAINTNIAAIASSNITTSADIAAIRTNTNDTAINTSNMSINSNTIASNSNLTVTNTDSIKSSLINIDPNILNISNKINDLALWLKDLRDFFLGAPGLGGVSVLPWFDNPVNQSYRDRDSSFQLLFDKFKNGQYLDSPVLDTTVHELITRYSLTDVLAITGTGTTADLKAETASAGLATSSVLSSGIAERAYYRAGLSMERLQAYLTDLQASATMKHSIDLNTRVLIELTQTNNEILRTISAYSIMQGAVVMSSNTDIDTETAP